MKDEKFYIVSMLECADRIASYTESGRDHFLEDSRTQDAVIRNFEILGEAAKRVSSDAQAKAPDIPWRRIAGFRDVLIHQYEGVDIEEVWRRVEDDLPRLHNALRHLLEQMQDNRPDDQ